MYYYVYNGLDVEKLELHYHLNDDSHSMDAFVRNSIEKELLFIIQQIAKELDLEFDIETFAYEEGGLKEIYQFIAKNAKKNKYLTGILAGIVISVVSHQMTRDFEGERLEKEKTKLEIELLKKQLNEYEADKPNEQIVKTAVKIFSFDLKIIKHKSNYYQQLVKYPKVDKIETQALDFYGNKKGVPSIIERKDFDKYILDSDMLQSEKDEKAIIEIISPVLKKGNYKWKGIYLKTNETISFYMKDTEFKNHVVSDGIPFQNGSQIKCELEIEKKLNEIGEKVNSGYSVLLVDEIFSSDERIVTEHSVRIHKERLALKQQTSIIFPEQKEEKN